MCELDDVSNYLAAVLVYLLHVYVYIGKWWYKDSSAIHEVPSFYIRHYHYVPVSSNSSSVASDTLLLSVWIDIVNPKENETIVSMVQTNLESTIDNESYKYSKEDIHKWKVKSFPQLQTPIRPLNNRNGTVSNVTSYVIPELNPAELPIKYYQTTAAGVNCNPLEFNLGAYVDELLLDDVEPVKETPFLVMDPTQVTLPVLHINSRHNTTRIQINSLVSRELGGVNCADPAIHEISMVDLKCSFAVPNTPMKEYVLKLLIPLNNVLDFTKH